MDLISRRKEASIAFVLVVLFVYFGVSTPDFLGTDNLRVIGQFTAAIAIIAVGEVMLLISGEIDLSLGNIYGMTPFLMWFGTEWGFPLPLAVVFGLLGAAAVGAINGILTVTTGVPSFITTLGMIFFLNGFTLTISDGFPKPAPEGGVRRRARWRPVLRVHLGRGDHRDRPRDPGEHALGRAHRGHRAATRSARARPVCRRKRIKVGNFMLAAVLAGFAGISEAIRVDSIDPLAGRRRTSRSSPSPRPSSAAPPSPVGPAR